jgi:hypothetical protein
MDVIVDPEAAVGNLPCELARRVTKALPRERLSFREIHGPHWSHGAVSGDRKKARLTVAAEIYGAVSWRT